ncbi:Alpha/beta hydrolase fold-3 [Deinococcus phoenicis]|uniref:Alpha/beta hydrolase fold-3 n=1 Tax=Deinococcus phoenicis TaxID=1476583 RepID=A0A016QMA0_9DEIO|nr:alpha/beta hydrolase [Deinococcus phoenicis]EYB66909.1 Alpha/beta hydrolase fold-3 [Deinococcus phoenicis]
MSRFLSDRRAFPPRLGLLALGGLALGLTLTSCSGVDAQDALNRAISTRGLTVVTDQPYGPDARNRIDVYAPADARNAPVVLFVHGGSWQGGDKVGHKFVGESLARAGYVTGVMNYRLAPQNRYPAYVQDTAAALRWLRDHAKSLGGNPDDLFVTGHSAGAFNAVEAVDNARWLREAGVPISAVRGVIGIAGPYSYDFRQFQSRVAFPEGSTPDEVMPDRHVRPDAPPHLLLVAANDTTVHPQNALNMEAALKKAGVPVTRTVLPRVNHITIAAALARPLTFLGGTRQAVIDFIEAHRLK